MRIRHVPCIACVAALALLLRTAERAFGHDEQPPLPQIGAPDAYDELQQEMIALFGQVERKLRRVDGLLAEAGSGRTRKLSEVSAAGIDELLRQSLEAGRSSVQDIDRLLEIAREMGQRQSQSSCSSCQSGSCDKPGHGGGKPQQSSQGQPEQSPLDRGEQSARRESTPEGPGGERPGPEQTEQPEEGGQPKSPLGSRDDNPENREAGDPPALATGEASRLPLAAERWGDLPVHVQDMFRTEGDRHVPARYRDWIDAYYRRLATRAQSR